MLLEGCNLFCEDFVLLISVNAMQCILRIDCARIRALFVSERSRRSLIKRIAPNGLELTHKDCLCRFLSVSCSLSCSAHLQNDSFTTSTKPCLYCFVHGPSFQGHGTTENPSS